MIVSGAATSQGWTALGDIPDTVTYSGNGSYDLVFNSNDLTDTVSNGMKIEATRTVTAPIQCTDLELSSTHYFSKSTPAATTFTDDFVCSAWVKLESHGAVKAMLSRYDGTSGWSFTIGSNGLVSLTGFNASSANNSQVLSIQSIPLGEWVHIAAQLDMSTFTATTTTSYIMINGVDVPATVARGGSNPTALIQAGDLEVGGRDGGTVPFDGKLAQVGYYSSKVTQADVAATINQTFSGSETSLVSAYSFNNVITDLNTGTANDLTAQNSALATDTDTPFSGGATGTTEYGIITANAFSTNTTLTVQAPKGYALPTTGGVSAMQYSTNQIPYGFPSNAGLWEVGVVARNDRTSTSTSYATFVEAIAIPIGIWDVLFKASIRAGSTGATSGDVQGWLTLSSDATTETDEATTLFQENNGVATGAEASASSPTSHASVDLAAATTFTVMAKAAGTTPQVEILGSLNATMITAKLAYI